MNGTGHGQDRMERNGCRGFGLSTQCLRLYQEQELMIVIAPFLYPHPLPQLPSSDQILPTQLRLGLPIDLLSPVQPIKPAKS